MISRIGTHDPGNEAAMENARGPRRSTLEILCSLTCSVLRLSFKTMHLGALYAILYARPWVRPFLLRLALLGTAVSVYLETVVRVPDFPFWSVMQLWIGCAVLLLVHRHIAGRKPC